MKPIQSKSLIALSSLAVLLSLGACNRNDDRTAGQKLDSAIAKTDAAADRAKEDAKVAAAKTENAVQNAADATKVAGANAAADVKDASARAAAATENAGAKVAAATENAGAKVADATRNAGAKIAEKFDDAAITAKVNTGFMADKELSAIKIDVDTKDGVVTLNGPAPTAAAKARATDIARNVKGVSSVNNQLAVRG